MIINSPPLASIATSTNLFPTHPPQSSLTALSDMRPISKEIQKNILYLLEIGQPSRKIANQLGVSRITVDRLRARARPGVQKARGGRPAKLSMADKRRVIQMITTHKANTAVQAAQELKDTTAVEVSTKTVQRALREAGMRAVTKKKKPRLLPRHIKERKNFALCHQHWTVEDWKRVIWSDETKINHLGSDGCKWVWKRQGEGLKAHQVQGTVKFGGGNLMLWGCMTAEGVGYACRIDGRMDSKLYTSILGDELTQTIKYFGLDKSKVIFQQDNDPKHTSKEAQKWFSDNNIQILQWPAQSPDLNPIEHLWNYLKRKLAEYETEPKGMLELWERVEAEWDKIPQEICAGLIESMPSRIAELLKAGGGPTKY